MADLHVDDTAPLFSLPATTGKTISLSDYAGKKRVVLYFYPKDDTSGCTKEACSFRDTLPRIDVKDTVVLGVSPDDLKSHQKFIDKYGLNFPLLSDSDHKVAEAYGAWGEKSMYGKKYFGIIRKTFIIGKDGKLEHVFHKVSPEGHGEEILKLI
ncbi:MAG TPA: thioredoxin-dependent thiol peroxidase [bacterium]|nr:thioredoxin-dependent thiol peroxidase [bacterium]HOH07026.1 thioredoxin-dependent thiol peroxidase [bacterium]HOY43626.1 thioredoxin-dependent thiol peroxidase [bacterium]HPG81846.1 thioredoxin-dependent thiol peroxidase [bacterium]HPM60347.1 thioredoxin-dependent thiol peroxidase [bacterium]